MKKILLLISVVTILVLTPLRVSAESPYTTWAQGPGGWLTMTQDAYSPAAEVDLPISAAEEMVVMPDGTLYIADTGNGRILAVRLGYHAEKTVALKDVKKASSNE